MAEWPTIGSPLRRLKHRLGFCWCCWRRWQRSVDFAGVNGSEPASPATRYRLCAQHEQEWTSTLLSVPHTGKAEFTDGSSVEWSTEEEA